MPNRFALVVHYLACFKAGLVATPLNYRYMAPEIDHALAVSDARALLAHVEREEDLAASQLAPAAAAGHDQLRRALARHERRAFDELIDGERPCRALRRCPIPARPR